MITPLPYHKAISFLEEIHTDGNSPITVIADDYAIYLVKNSKNKDPATDIINEVLCYYFLALWNIPVAEAAIIEINPQHLLPSYSTNNHRKHYYNKPVFGSKWINSAVESTNFIEVNGKVDYKRFNNPLDLFKIGLFDIWIENDDRKPTNHNLLLQTINDKQTVIPIDHCFVFSTLTYNNLDPDLFCPIANDNILVSNWAKSLQKFKQKLSNEVQSDEEYFYVCIEKCRESYQQIINTIPEKWGFTSADAENLFNFLFNQERNKKVFQDYISKVY